MTKTAPGSNSTKQAIHYGQGLSCDFSFSGAKSKITSQRKDVVGINGEICWVLITNYHTGTQYGKTCQRKASPIKWLRQWLLINSLVVKDKHIFLDQGGELRANPHILNVFTNFRYETHPTGTDSSQKNNLVEHAHPTIGDHVCALLIGASLDIKFCPYVFFYHLRILNTMAMNGQNSSQIFQATRKKENFSDFWYFGYRVWI